jgi:hypothetical protein
MIPHTTAGIERRAFKPTRTMMRRDAGEVVLAAKGAIARATKAARTVPDALMANVSMSGWRQFLHLLKSGGTESESRLTMVGPASRYRARSKTLE